LGFGAGKYKSSSSISFNKISLSEYEYMRAVISIMSAENMTLKKQLKTREELIRASYKESRVLQEQLHEDSRSLQKQFQRFMESFLQGHSHLPPCSNPPYALW